MTEEMLVHLGLIGLMILGTYLFLKFDSKTR